MKKKNIQETGITLVALVVTIIVLLILAGVTINMALSNNGLIQRAKDASETYAKAEQNEAQLMAQYAEDIDELTEKTTLSEDKIKAVNDRVKDPIKELKEVAYEAKKTDGETGDLYDETKGRGVTVDGANNGGLADQVFYQSEVGAIGTNKLKWYVLSADEKGVNLVSSVTKKSVQFKDSSGYDNCLYYLNELSTKLFANEEYGVTENRIHALNLTDIKTAAEQANAGYKVTDNGTERDWSWDLDVIKASDSNAYNNGNVGQKTMTISNKYYPGLYTADTNKEVVANNPMYDEEPGSLITTDTGITRGDDGSNPASKLKVNHTFFSTSNSATTLTRLGKFGESNIGKELFKASGVGINYWLASRSVYADGIRADFNLRYVFLNSIHQSILSGSSGDASSPSCAFRVVVSVPASCVNIAGDGTVTLKAKKS